MCVKSKLKDTTTQGSKIILDFLTKAHCKNRLWIIVPGFFIEGEGGLHLMMVITLIKMLFTTPPFEDTLFKQTWLTKELTLCGTINILFYLLQYKQQAHIMRWVDGWLVEWHKQIISWSWLKTVEILDKWIKIE